MLSPACVLKAEACASLYIRLVSKRTTELKVPRLTGVGRLTLNKISILGGKPGLSAMYQ